jgi:molybdopterin/thiamine biosynthesis adenylyltransferase
VELRDLAQEIKYLGALRTVIGDAPLLSWAQSHQVSPWEAQLAALRQGIILERYLSHGHSLNLDQQLWLCVGKVLILGCGGLGGVLINLLSRAGVGFLRLVDGDVFAPANLNRQWFCDADSIGRPKVQVSAARLERLNPFTRVEAVAEPLTDSNALTLMANVDLALDALDNIDSRLVLGRIARECQIPFVHAAVAGWCGQVSTFLPDSRRRLTDVYGGRQERDTAEIATGIIGTTAALMGSLQAAEAIRLLTGQPPAYADGLYYLDSERTLSEACLV